MMNTRSFLLTTFTALVVVGWRPVPAAAQAPATMPPPIVLPEYSVRRTLGAVKIDGVLDEESWRKAVSTGPITSYYTPNSPRVTEAKLLWDDTQLYLAITCLDTDVRGTRTAHDSDVFAEDCVELFIMEQRFKDKYQHFLEYEINALGSTTDAYNVGEYEGIAGWESKGWKCAVKVDGTINDKRDIDKGWTVEMSIPFFDFYGNLYQTEALARKYLGKSFPQCTPNPGDRWRANIHRIKYLEKSNEYFAWSPNRRPKGFHDPERFGTLVFSAQSAGTVTAEK